MVVGNFTYAFNLDASSTVTCFIVVHKEAVIPVPFVFTWRTRQAEESSLKSFKYLKCLQTEDDLKLGRL